MQESMNQSKKFKKRSNKIIVEVIGVVIYKIMEDNSLLGDWTIKGTIGKEIAIPLQSRKSLIGDYAVTILLDQKEIFEGTLIITAINQRVFSMKWLGNNLSKGQQQTFLGIGILRDGFLAANYYEKN